MSLGNVGGLIGTAVGLSVLLGVTGLAFRAVERTFPDNRGRKGKRSNSGNGGIFDPAPQRRSTRSSSENIFDLGLTQRSSTRNKKSKFRNDFGGDFNIFAV